MTTIDLHPEHLIDRERAGTLDDAERERLIEHREQCATCALEQALADDFALEPDDAERARAARIVAAMFEGAPLVEADPVSAPEERRGHALAWAALSIAVHAALLAIVLMLPAREGERAASLDPIEITVRAPAASAPSLPRESSPAEALPAPRTTDVAPRHPRARLAAIGARPSVDIVEPDVVAPGTAPDTVEPDTVEPRIDRGGLAALLDPAHVARSGVVFEGAPSQRGAPAGLGAPDRGVSERDLEQRLETGLHADAMTKTYTHRTRPELHRRPDGSQAYEGPRFTAIIRPDGSVHFDDRPNVATNGFSASGTFDLTEAVMGAAGQDPLVAEREWFMRNTEELRHRLEAEHRRREMDAALRRLPGRLTRVWGSTSHSPASRRRRIFDLWDEMDEDETGQRARRIVIEFVREVLPAGGEDAYTDDELRRLNASRQSREPFAPY